LVVTNGMILELLKI